MRIQGKISPCGGYVYAGTWDLRNFSMKPIDSSGIQVWNLHTGKLEMSNMRAMERNVGVKTAVTSCFWLEIDGGRKVMISACMDKCLRLFA